MNVAVQVPIWLRLLAVGIALVVAPRSVPAVEPTSAPIAVESGDAELFDVQFIDAANGWAVGDRGVIWHTSDAGKTWALQPSGETCRLSAVMFLDNQTGWAAGGFTYPVVHSTYGVLLKTTDGGQTWRRERGEMLPAIRHIRFFNRRFGWAVCEPSPLFPSGLFYTESGGEHWSSVPTDAPTALSTGDFLDPHTGVVIGRQTGPAMVRNRDYEPARSVSNPLRGIHEVRLLETQGWLVGDGGLLLATVDQGKSWQKSGAGLPAGIEKLFDWQAVEARGADCWVAGAPGTRVLHSANGGRSWTSHPTAQNLPIRALSFAGNLHGWAVGSLGLILATQDGGQSWQVQHSGGNRVALWGLFTDPESVPLELVARLSANDGYLSAIEILPRRDLAPDAQSNGGLSDRLHEAAVAAGASAAEIAWPFPVRQRGLLLKAEDIIRDWDRVHGGQGRQRLESHLVRQIRMWRPDVIVTHASGSHVDDPLETILNQAVIRAAREAADPTIANEQLTVAGLEPWSVKKVLGQMSGDEHGDMTVSTRQLATRLGTDLASFALRPRRLISAVPEAPPQSIGFRIYVNEIPQGLGARDFLSGINLQPGSEARRLPRNIEQEDNDVLRRMAQRQRNLLGILNSLSEANSPGAQLAGQITGMLEGFEPLDAGWILYQLAEQYQQTGQWPLAVGVLEQLIERHADHPATPAALTWLIHYHASSEAAWRDRVVQTGGVFQTSFESDDAAIEAGQTPSAITIGDDAAQAATIEQVPFDVLRARAARAQAFGRLLHEICPAVYSEPIVQFPLAVAERQLGEPKGAERIYAVVSQARQHDAWGLCAQAEREIAHGGVIKAKESCVCTLVGTKPRLDGKLDDDIWQQAQPIELHSPLRDDAQWPAIVLLACDDTHLYWAISCGRAPGVVYDDPVRPRPRDPDLSKHDRVELYLDLDRDYSTAYQLVIDQRGWVNERCMSDASWNPTWFVATGGDRQTWTAEAAIPWGELTSEPPQRSVIWAVGLQRITPGCGFQSLARPASISVQPQGFVPLEFE